LKNGRVLSELKNVRSQSLTRQLRDNIDSTHQGAGRNFNLYLPANATVAGPLHVSDDNPHIESFFKATKYQPEFPKTFANIVDARAFCLNSLVGLIVSIATAALRC